ncbi:hypothetical protein CDV31_008751 [Fusarium ambrosium]|uniref:Uncharacterized protein n=1 Tax=Fusarium ambrosium TaxID=131363 RepID=A0A428TYX0_9HYPO|nr:hypothetical protein CDV31_008751 [Fusarium ambrosium]
MGPDPSDHPSVGLIGNLFNAILDSCVKGSQRITSNEQLRRLRSESERLFLWGDGVSAADGHLDKVLAPSSELYQAALSTLHELGKVANNDLAQAVAPPGPTNPPTETRELQRLLREAGVILNAPNATEDPDCLSDDENGPCSLEDVLDDMATYIDCLMDLSPVLETTLIYPESSFEPTATETTIVDPMEIEPTHTNPAVIDSPGNPPQGDEISQPSLSTVPTSGHTLSLRIDDGSLPSFQAKITLFEDTPEELAINLGPWEVQESDPRRVIWQGSNQGEVLEHYFPSNKSSDLYPHTLHTRHRPYVEPADLERYITFLEPHRIRYVNSEGVCIHDESVNVKYEFTSVESSIQFQGDLRQKDLVDFYDTDVVWTNIHGRTDSFGNVRGVATIQRLKLWRDRLTGLHSLSIYQNRFSRQYRNYNLKDFHVEITHIDDKSKQLRLETLNQDGGSGRRPIAAYWAQPQRRRNHSSESRLSTQPADDMRYLAIQFSDHGAYRRFRETWLYCQGDSMPQYQLTLSNQFELPSEWHEGDSAFLGPGPPNLTDATGSSSRQEQPRWVCGNEDHDVID